MSEQSAIERCIEYTKGRGDVPTYIFVAAERELAELRKIRDTFIEMKSCDTCTFNDARSYQKPCVNCNNKSEWRYNK